jgi:hypothetical protein
MTSSGVGMNGTSPLVQTGIEQPLAISSRLNANKSADFLILRFTSHEKHRNPVLIED